MHIGNDPISGQQSNVLPQLNVWEHIAFTYSSILGEGKIYLNGLVIHSFSSVEIIPSNVPLHIGGNSIVNAAYNTVDGKMDNIEIWNTVLSSVEIQQYTNAHNW